MQNPLSLLMNHIAPTDAGLTAGLGQQTGGEAPLLDFASLLSGMLEGGASSEEGLAMLTAQTGIPPKTQDALPDQLIQDFPLIDPSDLAAAFDTAEQTDAPALSSQPADAEESALAASIDAEIVLDPKSPVTLSDTALNTGPKHIEAKHRLASNGPEAVDPELSEFEAETDVDLKTPDLSKEAKGLAQTDQSLDKKGLGPNITKVTAPHAAAASFNAEAPQAHAPMAHNPILQAAQAGAAQATQAPPAPNFDPSASQAAAAQLTVHIQKAASDKQEKITVQLHPKELGSVDIQLEFGKDGIIRAVIQAERQETLDLLRQDYRALERALSENAGQKDAQLNFSLKNGDGGQNGDGGFSGSSAHTADSDLEETSQHTLNVSEDGQILNSRLDVKI